jgi:ssDNA-binding Zn-finger/Zn-ribbon topoisomerase 1
MIQVNVECPRCRASLMDPEHKIDDKDSIYVIIDFLDKRGWLRLSSLYGSYTIESEFAIPPDTVAKFFCPHCQHELKSKRTCDACGTPMVAMHFKDGGHVQICSRRGCQHHLVEFRELETELRAFYDRYSNF